MAVQAALYTNGKVVTGGNHGEAFSKLSCIEQEGELESGFYDPQTGHFFTDESDFYLKQIFLIRHGEAESDLDDAGLTDTGIQQIHKTAEYIIANWDIHDFEAIVSPYLRCIQTARIIAELTGLSFSIDERVHERSLDEPTNDFLLRIHAVLEDSPCKAIYVSHSDFIVNFTEQAVGYQIAADSKMTGGAVTFIDARRLVCVAKNL